MRAEAKNKENEDQQPSLSKEQILQVALELIDEQGLGALSIRRVADQLGVYPTAITWHIGSKDQLVAGTAALLFDHLELPDDQAMAWDDWLQNTAHRWRAEMHRHPHLAPVIGNRLTLSPPALPFVERVLRVLADGGLRGPVLVHAYNSYIGCLIGWVSLELSQSAGTPEQAERNYKGELQALNRKLFPSITGNLADIDNRAFMVRWSNGAANPLDESFEVMIGAVVDGIKRLAANDR